MTIAPTNSWNPAVTYMIRQALIKLAVIADDEQPTAPQFNDALFCLNGIVKSAEATGIHVWTEEEAILFVQPGQVKYIIGGPGLNANTSDADEWLELTLTSNVVLGNTTIPLNTSIGVSVGNKIGVILNDGATWWATVVTVPTVSAVTIDLPIPNTGASQGAFALVYSETISRPLRVPNARLLTLQGLNETPMTIMSRQEYMDTPNKLSPGTPTQWFYSPQRDKGLFYIWPAPQRSAWAIRFTWYRPLADLLTPDNTVDFPQEWVNPLIWALANEMLPDYDCPPNRATMIKEQAAVYSDLVQSYDRESEPVQFGLGWEYVTQR